MKRLALVVTGAAGFIGSHLCERLLAGGHRVIGIDNLDSFYPKSVKLANLAILRRYRRFSFHRIDVRRQASLHKALSGHKCRAIFHLAGRGGVPQSVSDPLLYLSETLEGTLSVLQTAVQHRVPLVINASSSSVYGQAGAAEVSESSESDRPTAPYAAYKKGAELLCHAWHHLYGLGVCNVRFFSVYGPRGRPDQIIYKFSEAIRAGRPIPWYEPEPVRDFTYVDDIVDGLVSMLRVKPATYHVLNLARGEPHPLSAVLKYLERALELPAIIERKTRKAPRSDFEYTHGNSTRASELLGWKPKVGLEEGIRRFVRWQQGR